jgi:hypothetical protein
MPHPRADFSGKNEARMSAECVPSRAPHCASPCKALCTGLTQTSGKKINAFSIDDVKTLKEPTMPPRKKRRATGSATSQSASRQESSPVESLPLTAAALIYQHCDAATRNSLLRTSRWGRELVLREARTIRLTLGDSDTAGARKPLVKLLDRACSAGEDGRLAVCVDAGNVHANSTRSKLLRDLFAPGLERHGWTSVTYLELIVSEAVG